MSHQTCIVLQTRSHPFGTSRGPVLWRGYCTSPSCQCSYPHDLSNKYGFEMLYTIAGWRVPLVLVNVSRGLASPITLEADHNDILAARDSGFLQIHTETCQEVMDTILMAYRLAEDRHVMLPVLVNLDGCTLSFTREPVVLPESRATAAFLPTYQPDHAFIRGHRPMAQGTAVLGGAAYSYFRYQQHRAQENALHVHQEIADAFQAWSGRHYGLVEPFQLDEADYVLVMSNAFATKGKAAVQRLRAGGMRIGLLRLRVLRPFPLPPLPQRWRVGKPSLSLPRTWRQAWAVLRTRKSRRLCMRARPVHPC